MTVAELKRKLRNSPFAPLQVRIIGALARPPARRRRRPPSAAACVQCRRERIPCDTPPAAAPNRCPQGPRARDAARPRRLRDAALRRAFDGPERASCPAMSRYSVDDLVGEAGELAGLGVKALLLFGVPDEKDDEGSGAWDEDGIVQRALRALRAEHPGARARHRRLPLRVHRARPLRRHPRRRGRERRDARAARADRGQPRRRRRRRRRAERHDGRARRRDPRGAAGDADPRLRRQVRLRLLRPVPRRRRVDAVLRRPARLPDGSGQRARGAARVRARPRRGRRRADGEAGAAVPRRDPRRPRALRLPRRRLQRLRRVRDGEGGGRGRPPRRAPGGARVADRDQARRRRPRRLLLDEEPGARGSEADAPTSTGAPRS